MRGLTSIMNFKDQIPYWLFNTRIHLSGPQKPHNIIAPIFQFGLTIEILDPRVGLILTLTLLCFDLYKRIFNLKITQFICA